MTPSPLYLLYAFCSKTNDISAGLQCIISADLPFCADIDECTDARPGFNKAADCGDHAVLFAPTEDLSGMMRYYRSGSTPFFNFPPAQCSSVLTVTQDHNCSIKATQGNSFTLLYLCRFLVL